MQWRITILLVFLNFTGHLAFSQIQFDDVSTDFQVHNEGNTSGVAFIDFDNDSDPDIFVVNSDAGHSNALYRNPGNDEDPFDDYTDDANLVNTDYGYATTWGDYDNDGTLDAFVTNHGNSTANLLYKNSGGSNPDFNLVPISLEGDADDAGTTWLDYDIDGDLDLFLLDHHGQGGGYFLWKNTGTGSFTNVTSSAIGVSGAGQCVVAADFDNDGDPDIYTTTNNPGDYASSTYFQNNGNGTFTRLTNAGGAPNSLKSDPRDPGYDGQAQGVTVGDYNNDGWLDLYIANDGPGGFKNRLYQNDGDGTFHEDTEAGVGYTGESYGAQFADFDNDGWLDLYVTNNNAPNHLYRNNGDETFTHISSATIDGGTNPSRASAIGDFDEDGQLDLYIGNAGSSNRLLQNATNNTYHYIRFRLQGAQSNPEALNARVRVQTNSNAQIREITGSSGYMSQNEAVVHFGLHNATSISLVEIRWPSGTIELTDGLLVDNQYMNEARSPSSYLICLEKKSARSSTHRRTQGFIG